MRGKLFLILTAALAMAAADPWTKVRDLKSGAEIRVFKKGAKQPVVGKLDQATEDSVVLVLKKEEISIPREDIDRLDARPDQKRSRVESNSTSKTENPAPLPPLGPHRTDDRPESSSSGSFTMNSRPDFETVYTRK